MFILRKGTLSVLIFYFVILEVSFSVKGLKRRKIFPQNFVALKFTNSSQRELRVAFKNIIVSETSAFLDSEYSMTFRQISDGDSLVLGVYQNKRLKDCQYTKDRDQLDSFIHRFSSEVPGYLQYGTGDVLALYENTSLSDVQAVQTFRHRKFLGPLKDIIKINRLSLLCRRFARKIQHENHMYRHIHDFRKQEKQFASELLESEISTYDDVDLLKLASSISNASQTYHSRSHPVTHAHKNSRSGRSKRSVWTNFLMYPGTKWCGRGQTARHYDELGEDNELDSCCREHDLCPLLIPPFSFRFHYFNFRFHAVLHCKCDEEFRSCLQQSLSKNANFVGKIYFNIMGSKCLVLREADICQRYSWWGTCLEYRKEIVAHVKPQRYYKYADDHDHHHDHVHKKHDHVTEELSNEV